MNINIFTKYAYQEIVCLLCAGYFFEMFDVTFKFGWLYAGIIAILFFTIANIILYCLELKEDEISFCKLKDSAVIPSKRGDDAGYDIYACFTDDWIEIKPNETKMIPTGLASIIDKKYVFILKERGSTGTKGLGQRSGVIDASYRGEWFVPLTNHNDKSIVILKNEAEEKWLLEHDECQYIKYPYTKAICQALLLPVPQVKIKEIKVDELEEDKTSRGSGALGSSGK